MVAWAAETCRHAQIKYSYLLLRIMLCLDVNIYVLLYCHTTGWLPLNVNNSWFQTFAVFWMSYYFFWVPHPYLLHIPARGLWPTPTPSPFFLMAQAIVRAKPLPVYTPTFTNLVHSTHTYSPVKMEQSVPKRRHLKLIRRGITQKK
jgi:hypothetical protein